jgi:hypothetical protein
MDGVIVAHGLGGRGDLPISPDQAVAGAVLAMLISFCVLTLAWQTPRYTSPIGRPAPRWLMRVVESRAFATIPRIFGAALFGYTVWVAVWGPDLLSNPIFGMFYVLLWVGIVPASLLLGPVWKAISPFRTINELLSKLGGAPSDYGLLGYPPRWGYWPAALGLFAFVWFELVYPLNDELSAVRLWIAAYSAAMVIGALLGGDGFLEHADPFEVYSSLVAKMSPWGRHDGRLMIQSPLANLATLDLKPGLVAVVAVLFGSTAFDSFKDSIFWQTRTQDAARPLLLDNAVLVGLCLLVGGLFSVAAAASPAISGRRALPRAFAHSIVPIVIGYVVAHYASYLVAAGQTTLIQMSDPFANGSNLLGTAGWVPNTWLARHPTFLANLKVGAVIAGHIVGVVAAHDRALVVLPARHRLTGQLPLLLAMVAFTIGGLYLLFAD